MAGRIFIPLCGCIAVDPTVSATYAGVYKLPPTFSIAITLEKAARGAGQATISKVLDLSAIAEQVLPESC
jgi:hypothetical protein